MAGLHRAHPHPAWRRTEARRLAVGVLAILLGVLLFAETALAERRPAPGRLDARMRTVVYTPDDVVTVQAALGMSTMIQFGEGEQIRTIAAGDTVGWQIAPDAQRTVLFVKPLEPDSATNMHVVTSRGTYSFRMVGTKTTRFDGDFKVRFVYPEERARERRARDIANPNLRALRRESLNWDYGVKGAEQNRPLIVFDDGVKTFFRFEGEVPAIFAVDEARNETLLNFRREGEYLVVDRTARQFTLRNGEVATCLYNLRTQPVVDPRRDELAPFAPRRLDGGLFSWTRR
jgi:type IV secretion system protein VirB9